MAAPSGKRETIHASAVVLGEGAVLIRGPSGAGKSSLAIHLVRMGKAAGRFARLVGDDRVSLEKAGSRLIVRPHPLIAGKIERRWEGIASLEHLPAAVLCCSIELVGASQGAPARLPEPAEMYYSQLGNPVPQLRLPVSLGVPEQALRLWDFVDRINQHHNCSVFEK